MTDRKDPFGMVPNSVMRNPNLSLSAKGLIAITQTHAATWTFTQRQLIDVTGHTRKKAMTIINEAVSTGLISESPVKNEDGKVVRIDYRPVPFGHLQQTKSASRTTPPKTPKDALGGSPRDALGGSLWDAQVVPSGTTPEEQQKIKHKNNTEDHYIHDYDHVYEGYLQRYFLIRLEVDLQRPSGQRMLSDLGTYWTDARNSIEGDDLVQAASGLLTYRHSLPDDTTRPPMPDLAELFSKRFWLWKTTKEGIAANDLASKKRQARFDEQHPSETLNQILSIVDSGTDLVGIGDLLTDEQFERLANYRAGIK